VAREAASPTEEIPTWRIPHKKLDIAHGPYIPDRECFSLLFRGVNMSFKASDIHDVRFPEHPLLKRAPGNE
jgi:hypothetical protein